MATYDSIIQNIRDSSENTVQIGQRFERFSMKFLTADPLWANQFNHVETYSDWAKRNRLSSADTGIDLVAELSDGSGFAAIQCKCYQADHTIQKTDLDKFISAATKDPFKQLIFIDTTAGAWGKNAEDAVEGRKNFKRIRLDDFKNSSINWDDFESKFESDEAIILLAKKEILSHQIEAVEDVMNGFEENDRGKLIMACGTGKTFTSLKIAEKVAGKDGSVLLLVPSLALMSQTIREWYNDCEIYIQSIAVCSDSQVSKAVQRRRANADNIDENTDIDARDLAIPVTTNAIELIEKVPHKKPNSMTVVFCTYQSISVIEEAQQSGLFEFDIIICDEAHRTTGLKFKDEDISYFTKVHDNKIVCGKKRLYMTATPKIFGEKAVQKANSLDVELWSMDDEKLFGPVFHTLKFGKAVSDGLLVDYKVVVLAIDQMIVSRSIQKRFATNSELNLDSATKIVGCYRALQKYGDQFWTEREPMRRAIMFCDNIQKSKLVRDEFEYVIREFVNSEYIGKEKGTNISCKIEHVDGTFNSKERDKLLSWLGEKPDSSDDCRILSNARCLSEGVDVPDLDAILFMHPRKSQVDVVQAVGRVMRKSKDKKMGYIVLPVVIPAHKDPKDALNDNKNYGIVWSVLNALRSHDDRFDSIINKHSINKDFGQHIEVIAEISELRKREKTPGSNIGKSTKNESEVTTVEIEDQPSLFDEFTEAMHAKIVKKCGNRMYWQDWAKNACEITQKIIERINAALDNGQVDRKLFENFHEEIQRDLNESISEKDAIEMLGQHFVTRPIFDALFSGTDFVQLNPVSKAMQSVIDSLELKNVHTEANVYQEFYGYVETMIGDIKEDKRQDVINILYEKFFTGAFPTLSERLGIVYTPSEIVDFINHSVNDILKQEFGKNFGSKGVHILDPFTGTGTFISRLLQSNLISKGDLEYKFKNEIHANEMVLLAYYIAAINIETEFNRINGGSYTPFSGICFTDTFKSSYDKDIFSNVFEINSDRRNRQNDLNIEAIIGNPPYSARQKNENDNAKNVEYPTLDEGIKINFADTSNAQNRNALYDTYIKAIYWACDRLGDDGGVVGFVTGNSWLDGTFADGMRKFLEKDCNNIYIINLRGNIRTNMQNPNSGEGGNVFGNECMVGVAISFFIKHPKNAECNGGVFYYDIGDGLGEREKLIELSKIGSIQKLIDDEKFKKIHTDKFGDWLNKRDEAAEKFLPMGGNKATSERIFKVNSNGVKTQRNPWCINSSKSKLRDNVNKLITNYNLEVSRIEKEGLTSNIDDFVTPNPKEISWSIGLKNNLKNKKKLELDESNIRIVHTKPFYKQWLYYGKDLNERIYKIPEIFPCPSTNNRVIVVNGRGTGADFSALMCDTTIELNFLMNSRAFPILIAESETSMNSDSADTVSDNSLDFKLNEGKILNFTDGITDIGVSYFQKKYNNNSISKTDIFNYIYGLLYSSQFKSKFSANLKKDIPFIPPVKLEEIFWKFVSAGQKLGDLHVNYEDAELYNAKFSCGGLEAPNKGSENQFFKVNGMKFGKNKSEIVYNENIKLVEIPEGAFDFKIEGKSAIEWVMKRQKVTSNKDSGITNNPNDFAIETMNDPAYPLKLLLKIISVSIATYNIIIDLPEIEIEG